MKNDAIAFYLICGTAIAVIMRDIHRGRPWDEVTKVILRGLIWPVLALIVAFVVYPGNAIFSKSLASVTIGDGASLLVSAALAYYAVNTIFALFLLWREAAE